MGMCTLRPLVAATFMACALLIVIRSPLAVADDHASQGVFGWLMYVPGEDGGPVGLLARVVVETNSSLLSSSPSCAEVTFSAADGAQPLLTVQRGNNPDPDLFPVIVCDASVPFDTALSVYVGESETPVLELRSASQAPGVLVTTADSGCRNPEEYPDVGCAFDTPAARLQAWGATLQTADPQPDAILHLGDYVYRHYKADPANGVGVWKPEKHCALPAKYTSSNAADSNPAMSDRWSWWKWDWFMPTAPFLANFPWLLLRGDHEICSLSGPGFFFMLDVGSGNDGNGTLLERSCPTQPTTASNATITAENFASVVEVLPPMHYKFPTETTPDYVALDTVQFCEETVDQDVVELYLETYQDTLSSLADNSTVCLSHKPLYFKRWDDSYNGTTLQALVEQTGVFTSGAFTHKCMYWSAAHAHLFQVLNFPDDPDIGASQMDRLRAGIAHFITGAGGVNPDAVDEPGEQTFVVDGTPALVYTSGDMGVLHFTLSGPNGAAWDGSYAIAADPYNPSNAPMAPRLSCSFSLDEGHAGCESELQWQLPPSFTLPPPSSGTAFLDASLCLAVACVLLPVLLFL